MISILVCDDYDKNIHDSTRLEAFASQCQSLIDSRKTLALSTLSEKGLPDISYAPFIRGDDGEFYIFVSDIAHHTGNLLANPSCSVLFAAPESATKNVFTLERAIFNCRAVELKRESQECEERLNQMQEILGNTVEVLRNLADFHLFALKPVYGQYTVGFGKAFIINPGGSLTHINSDNNNTRGQVSGQQKN